MLSVVQDNGGRDDHAGGSSGVVIEELVREGARRMLVRNGAHEPREVLTSAGSVEVTAPL